MKKYWFWIIFICVNIALGTVLIQYEHNEREKNSYLIQPYLEGYDDSLHQAVQTAEKLTGSDKETQWQLELLEQKLKRCTYYIKTWGDRGGKAKLTSLLDAQDNLTKRIRYAWKASSPDPAEVRTVRKNLAAIILQSSDMRLIPDKDGSLVNWANQVQEVGK